MRPCPPCYLVITPPCGAPSSCAPLLVSLALTLTLTLTPTPTLTLTLTLTLIRCGRLFSFDETGVVSAMYAPYEVRRVVSSAPHSK